MEDLDGWSTKRKCFLLKDVAAMWQPHGRKASGLWMPFALVTAYTSKYMVYISIY